MDHPGDSLKQEREARGKTIEEMAEATGIRLHLLSALEQDAFDSLPGRGFGKLYIRAYAEVLGFDPRPVIEAYDRLVRETEAAAPAPSPPSAPRPVEAMRARWRQERMARRAEADLAEEPEEEETFDESEAVETEFEPEPIEDLTAVEAQPDARKAPEIIEEAAEAAPEHAATDRETAPELMEEPTVRTVPLHVEAVSPSRAARSLLWPVASLILVVLLPLLAYLVVSRSKPNVPRVAGHAAAPAEASAPYPSRPPLPEPAEPPRTPPRQQAPVREPAAPSSLEVAESGVGLRLVGTRLEGEGDRFRSGQRVTFATRVLGGGAGQSIRHVWLRDGKVEQSIRLRLGGASWRTYSTKTLGRPGTWAVEARDEQGRVLARADLTVEP